jgi:hypothetical protein
MQAGLAFAFVQARRTRHDDFVFSAAVVDLDQHQPVRVGMRAHGKHLGGEDFVRVPRQFRLWVADCSNCLKFQAGQV